MRRLQMRKIAEALRLRAAGLTTRKIAASLNVGQSTISEYLKRAERAGLSWPLPNGIDASRIVAPLRDAGRYAAFPGLTPSVEVEGTTWIVRVQELAAVPSAQLREPVGSLSEHRDALKRALDILIDGV